MKKELKIVTIGAGSSYTPELCDGLIKRFDKMPIKEWVLVDVDDNKKRALIIYKLVNRMFKAKEIDIKLSISFKLSATDLKDADFVTTQLRVGLQQARKHDEETAFKHGILGQETNGIAGQFKAMRTIPVIENIVAMVKTNCPQAWIINFANPSGIVTEYVNRYLKYPNFIGVCNVPIHTRIAIAKMFNKHYKDIKTDAAGLNHMVFFNKFYIDKRDATSEVFKRSIDSQFKKSLNMKNVSSSDWNPKFITNLKALPCSYHKYYYKRGLMLKRGIEEYRTIGTRGAQVMKIENRLFKKYEDPNLKSKPEELNERGGAHYSDIACGVINAIYNDTNEEFIVNVVNENKIRNLARDWTVEVTCKINKNGAQKVSRNIELSRSTFSLVNTIKTYELILTEAIYKKDINQALLAAFINPLSEDDFTTEKVFFKLLKDHAKYIKGWK